MFIWRLLIQGLPVGHNLKRKRNAADDFYLVCGACQDERQGSLASIVLECKTRVSGLELSGSNMAIADQGY
ncbi:conserved hypothetical protein [Ricinus communis]|uniref:Uncharacterized protein n=1 Tax=Ricinus communis TaxID=3988 RepID=B9S613_RICCO|nr:conserved hypothetical protein [Ricinus communis]